MFTCFLCVNFNTNFWSLFFFLPVYISDQNVCVLKQTKTKTNTHKFTNKQKQPATQFLKSFMPLFCQGYIYYRLSSEPFQTLDYTRSCCVNIFSPYSHMEATTTVTTMATVMFMNTSVLIDMPMDMEYGLKAF